MHGRTFTLCLLAFAIGFSTPADAQQAHHSEINIAHRGVGTLKADLRYLLSLTSPVEQLQWQNIDGFLELLIYGLDENKPIRVDILSGIAPLTYIVWGPIKDRDELTENIEANFDTKRAGKDIEELLQPDPGWFRIISRRKYGVLTLCAQKDLGLLKQIIQKLTNPMPDIQSLLLNGANMGYQLLNKAATPADMDKRRDRFGEIRKNKEDTVVKRPSESATEFAMRKLFVSNQLDEVERLMVESSNANAKIFLDKVNGNAKVRFELTAIAQSSLAESIALFGQAPDIFDSVKKLENSVLSLRANHPIDKMRQKNALAFVDLAREDVVARLAKDEKLTAEQKEAAQQLFDGITAVTRDGISSGNVNGFLESTVNDKNEFVSIGAVSVVDGTRLDAALALIAKTGAGNKVNLAVETVGETKIHELQLAAGFFKPFDDVFGAGKTGYVATSKNIVWIGTGKESLDALKSAISSLKEPKKNDVVFNMDGNLLPWVKRTLNLVRKTTPVGRTEIQQRRDQMRSLELATQAFSRNDDASFQVTVKDGVVGGEIFVNTGVLRYLGRELAFYSKNNLGE